LHKSHVCIICNPNSNISNKKIYQQPIKQDIAQTFQTQKTKSVVEGKGLAKTSQFNSENSFMQMRFETISERSLQTSGLLRFFFSRHGERVDCKFNLIILILYL
jgi:hypothetical protein